MLGAFAVMDSKVVELIEKFVSVKIAVPLMRTMALHTGHLHAKLLRIDRQIVHEFMEGTVLVGERIDLRLRDGFCA